MGARGAHPARRGGALEPLRPDLGRLSNPLAGKARAEDELAEVERRVEAEKPPPPAPPGPPSYFEQQLAELKRIKDTGRRARGTVTRHEATNREMFGSPVVMLHFDVEGRDIVFEHCYGWRHLKRYKSAARSTSGSIRRTRTRSVRCRRRHPPHSPA